MVALALVGAHVVGEEQIAFLAGEQEDEAVDQAQQVAMEAFQAELAAEEAGVEPFILRVQQAATQIHEGLGHAVAQHAKGAVARALRFDAPLFQQAAFGCAYFAVETGTVGQQPEDHVVVAHVVAEDHVEVNFEDGLAREAGFLRKSRRLVPLLTTPHRCWSLALSQVCNSEVALRRLWPYLGWMASRSVPAGTITRGVVSWWLRWVMGKVRSPITMGWDRGLSSGHLRISPSSCCSQVSVAAAF